MTEWTIEEEVIKYYKLENIDHCSSCHREMEDGYSTHEIELPDGKVATICCGVYEAIEKLEL